MSEQRTSDGLNHGLACHQQMLALQEGDPAESIRQAIAGARSFAAFQATGAPAPDWLAVHEEQCCRIGAIAIHTRLKTQTPLEEGWHEAAIQMLQRLNVLHQESVPWISAMLLDLSQSQASQQPEIPIPARRWEPGLLLHLHGFKCAGTTFIGSLARNAGDELLYVESTSDHQRLPWQQVQTLQDTSSQAAGLITSHLITVPPPGALAKLKVAFLRDPLARLRSAYRFQRHVQNSTDATSFQHYLQGLSNGALANYQTRQLSPQEPSDWISRQGWGARPELIDFSRDDLIVGLVERYDDSILVIEDALEQLGSPMNLAYARPLNTTTRVQKTFERPARTTNALITALTELDANLYRRAEARFEQRLAAIPDLDLKRHNFQERCRALINQPTPIIKPKSTWTLLNPQPPGP